MNITDSSHGYERKDVDVRSIVRMTTLTVVLIVVFLIGLNEYFLIETEAIVYEHVLEPGSKQLKEMQARDQEVLNSYGTVDSAKAVYRIPVERAMELIAKEAEKTTKGSR